MSDPRMTDICDRAGSLLARALVPDGWKCSGERFESPKELLQPYMASVRAASPDGQISMVMQTGEAFLEVVEPAGLNEKHKDGEIDPYFGIRMRRYQLAEDYLETIARVKAGESLMSFAADGAFPSVSGQEPDLFKEAVKDEAAGYLAEISRDEQWSSELKHVLAAHPMKMYRLEERGISGDGDPRKESEHILIVGADFYAFDYDLIGSGSGALSGLPGGLMGRGTGSYIRWGSRLIGSLNAVIGEKNLSDPAAGDAAQEERTIADMRRAAMRDFFRFAASFRWA